MEMIERNTLMGENLNLGHIIHNTHMQPSQNGLNWLMFIIYYYNFD